MREPAAGQAQYTIKQTMFGLVVMVRRWLPSHIPGDWGWGPWRKAGINEQNDILRRLTA